jgi:HEAT repeat protein
VGSTEALRSPALEERRAAIDEIARRDSLGDGELEALVECLGDARKAVQRPAAEALAALAGRGVVVDRVLDEALRSASPRLRWGAAYTLSLLGEPPPSAIPVLLETLGVDDGDVRWAAAGIVVGVRDRPALVDRLVVLVRDGNAAQRKMALYCLRDLGARSPATAAAALAALADEDAGVRLAAMASVPRLVEERSAAAAGLVAALAGGEERLRRAAAAALGSLGERSATVVAALRDAAGSPDRALARAAERSLRMLGAER